MRRETREAMMVLQVKLEMMNTEGWADSGLLWGWEIALRQAWAR